MNKAFLPKMHPGLAYRERGKQTISLAKVHPAVEEVGDRKKFEVSRLHKQMLFQCLLKTKGEEVKWDFYSMDSFISP